MKAAIFILVVGNLLLLGLALTPVDNEPQEIALPPLPPRVERLQLLSERGVTLQQPEAALQVPRQTSAVMPAPAEEEKQVGEDVAQPGPAPDDIAVTGEQEPATPSPVCHTIGPFATKKSAAGLMARLESQGAVTAMRNSEIQEPAGYWVYLPSMERHRALSIVDELKANGIEDYFLGQQNYISLGIYSQKSTAEGRLKEIAALGYEPKLEQRFKVRVVYWLDVEEQQPLFTEDEWLELLKDDRGVRRQNLACE